MSFVVELLKQTRRSFKARHLAFRAASFVLAGGVAFLALSTTSPRVRAAYGSFAHSIFVQPLQKIVKARNASKRQALAEREDAKRDMLRKAGSLSSPYVEVGEDTLFPLLVRVWLNVDSSHTARVTNNDERFPLVYERAISEQGFVPIVGLTFGDNFFDIEIRDSNGKQVARHKLAARIEDKEDVRSWISVKKKAVHNDFVSAALSLGKLYESSSDLPKTKSYISYYGVIDDLGDIRWLYRIEDIAWIAQTFSVFVDKQIFITDGWNKIFVADVFGNAKLVFDGKKTSSDRIDYSIHHGFTVTEKGTALILVDPLMKKRKRSSFGDIVLEVDLSNGKKIREIDLKDVLSDVLDVAAGSKIDDHLLTSKHLQDWMHLNSIVYDSESNTILLSGRHQNAVFAIDYKTSALQWMFADPEDFSAQQQARFLTAPEGYVFHKGQHDAQLQGNRLRFLDNAVLVKKEDGSYRDIEATPSRIVEATLDLANKKITKIKTYAPKSIFSKITSGYDFRDGKYLVCYCGIIKDVFGGYIADLRHDKNAKNTAELFEFKEGNDRELLHISIKDTSFRPRYFDWKKMVGAE